MRAIILQDSHPGERVLQHGSAGVQSLPFVREGIVRPSLRRAGDGVLDPDDPLAHRRGRLPHGRAHRCVPRHSCHRGLILVDTRLRQKGQEPRLCRV